MDVLKRTEADYDTLVKQKDDLLAALDEICDLPPDDYGVRTIEPGFLDRARAAIARATA